MKELAIKEAGQLGLAKELEDFQRKNDIQFPGTFTRFLILQNPYLTEPYHFYLDKKQYQIQHFFPFDADHELSLQGGYNDLKEFFQEKYIAFADDPGGWLFVISIQTSDYGKVYFCRMDEELEDALTLLADSFEEFINGLEPDNG